MITPIVSRYNLSLSLSGFNYGNNGFIAAGNSRLSSSSQDSSVGVAAGSTNHLSGKVSRVSSSKSSSSESNKSSRVKSGTNFGVGNQKIAANAYDASKTSRKISTTPCLLHLLMYNNKKQYNFRVKLWREWKY